MQYLITPYATSMQPYCWWEKTFTESELDILQNQAIKSEEKATVGGNPEITELHKIRRSQVSWLNYEKNTEWIFQKLSHVVSSLNSQFYRFELTGFGEPLQLTNYNHIENGMYGWHQDYGGNLTVSRKLSLVLQLTDPAQYEGGNLEIMVGGNQPITVRKQRGLIVVFPSYQLHQVTPVTQGSRQSLVSWISGPTFK